jgi:hypothetical protein
MRLGGRFVALLPLAAALAAGAAQAPGSGADFIWSGGPILAGKDLRPEALAVKDGKIVALGPLAEVEKAWKGKLTLPIDLHGQALVAGLVAGSPSAEPPGPPARAGAKPTTSAAIAKAKPEPLPKPKPPPKPAPKPVPKAKPPEPDPERPAPSLEALAADVSPPPPGFPYGISSIRDALRIWILKSRLPARHHLVLGVGYDVERLEEKRPPTREELDTVSATMPVIVVSKTGDSGAYNTIALQRAGISWRTKDPPGGVIRRRGRINEPNGVLEGTAHAAAFKRLVPKLDDQERARLLAASERLNAAEEPAPAPPAGAVAAAVPIATPAPPPPAPTPAPAAAAVATPAPLPVAPRDAGSPALAALALDALEGRARLEVGGPATLSVLSADPASSDPEKRAKLRVVEEVRKGRTVWRR